MLILSVCGFLCVYLDTNKQTEDDCVPKIFSSLFPCRLNASGECLEYCSILYAYSSRGVLIVRLANTSIMYIKKHSMKVV